MMFTEQYHSWDYAVFSAHLYRYLPQWTWQDHPRIYQKWAHYHRPKPLQSKSRWSIESISALLNDDPKILVLYHLGMHACIPQILAQHNIQFDILMDRKVYVKHQHGMSALRDKADRQKAAYRFLMSDDPAVLLKIRTTIRAGRHLLIFADGNSGTSDAMERKLKVNFLKSDLYVRTGIAVLSFLLQIPIVPIAHEWDQGHYRLFSGGPIGRLPKEEREEYIKRSMQLVFNFLTDQIKDKPWSWECWGYLHRQNCYTLSYPEEIKFNPDLEENIRLRLGDQAGIFNRKYFCYQFE